MLTLRQIEVIRAIMVTGTFGGAARPRFGSTVCALVTQGLGIAIVDEFTLAGGYWPQVRALDIAEATAFPTYVAHRKDAPLSSYGEYFVAALRDHMEGLTAPERGLRRANPIRSRTGRKKMVSR
jgi:DNA-binding transcriptional LysR family regulator